MDSRAVRTSWTQSSTFPVFAYRANSTSSPNLILPSRAWICLVLLSKLLEQGRLLTSTVPSWVLFPSLSSNWFLRCETRELLILEDGWLMAAAAVCPRTGGGWRNPFSKIGSFRYFRSRSVGGLYSESDRISAEVGDFLGRSTGSKKPLSPSGSSPIGFLGFGWKSPFIRETMDFLPACSVFGSKLFLFEVGSELAWVDAMPRLQEIVGLELFIFLLSCVASINLAV